MTTRPLGINQIAILRVIVEYHSYYAGCGWIWNNRSETLKLLDSLARRGLVKKFPQSKTYPYEVWRPTESGIKLTKELHPWLK